MFRLRERHCTSLKVQTRSVGTKKGVVNGSGVPSGASELAKCIRKSSRGIMQIVGWNPSADGSDGAYSNLREFIHGTGPTTHQFCLSVSLPPLAGRSSFFYLYFWPLHPFLLRNGTREAGGWWKKLDHFRGITGL